MTAAPGTSDQLRYQVGDFATDDLSELPDPAYRVITCRPAFRFITDECAVKAVDLDRPACFALHP
ncbi:hypothetical protein [Streptomyces griseorubiginosus]|uniref:hypothetical protein n=1 Tax=Streptomyces griseorubiginosus TaxID=67304 RepID=UPI0011407B98|nr:hypothetical protein [Streptomyces griseorubiginosus]